MKKEPQVHSSGYHQILPLPVQLPQYNTKPTRQLKPNQASHATRYVNPQTYLGKRAFSSFMQDLSRTIQAATLTTIAAMSRGAVMRGVACAMQALLPTRTSPIGRRLLVRGKQNIRCPLQLSDTRTGVQSRTNILPETSTSVSAKLPPVSTT